jgi:hypothetical protein
VKTTEKTDARSWWTSAAVGGGALTRDDEGALAARAGAAGAVQAPPLDPDAEPRGSLRRYLKFQLKDFLRERGSWMLALGGAFVALFRATYMSVAEMRERFGNGSWPNVSEADFFREKLVGKFALMAFFGILIATHGIVSRDRERGFQRFLFAKPVRAARYYLQSFLVNGAGFLGVGALLLACTAAAFARGVPAAGMLAVAAGAYAAIGGLTFLLSTLVRYDFALAGVLTAGAMLAEGMALGRFGRGWTTFWRGLALLLPPVYSLGEATQALSEGHTLAAIGGTLAPLVYGVACVVLALAVIRRRSIAS